MAENLVGEKDGGSCIAVTNLIATSSRPAPRPKQVGRVSSNSVVKVQPVGTCELVTPVATEVTDGLEVPNNNSSGQQPVARVASDIEVPNKSSELQLGPLGATEVTNGLEVPNNNSSGQQPVARVASDIEVLNNSSELQLGPLGATEVTSGPEFPNNNSSGQQIVDHVASEVPNNNNSSGHQLGPHVHIDIPSSSVVPNNTGPQDGNNGGDWKHAALAGLADCATAITALVNKTPSSSEPMYLAAEVVVFTAGILGVLGAFWVSRDARNRRAAERMILYTSYVSCILGLVLNFYAYIAKE